MSAITSDKLRHVIASLECVQDGWAFGVPEDRRSEWLDLVVQAVREAGADSDIR